MCFDEASLKQSESGCTAPTMSHIDQPICSHRSCLLKPCPILWKATSYIVYDMPVWPASFALRISTRGLRGMTSCSKNLTACSLRFRVWPYSNKHCNVGVCMCASAMNPCTHTNLQVLMDQVFQIRFLIHESWCAALFQIQLSLRKDYRCRFTKHYWIKCAGFTLQDLEAKDCDMNACEPWLYIVSRACKQIRSWW